MKIWKWLGWDTKEARTERVRDNNKTLTERNRDNNVQSSIKWGMVAVAAVGIAAIIWL